MREIVAQDYARIQQAETPCEVLDLSEDADSVKVTERYERYERFYRAENFERFDDNELVRKALEIRRMVSRAVVDIQGEQVRDNSAKSIALDESSPVLGSTDADAAAFADIYFRDGLSYLKIGDLRSARDCFQRSLDYDPGRGLALAYQAYTNFKLQPESEKAREECRESLIQAEMIEPQNTEIHVLIARFAINMGREQRAVEAVEHIQNLDPDHPKLERLWERIESM